VTVTFTGFPVETDRQARPNPLVLEVNFPDTSDTITENVAQLRAVLKAFSKAPRQPAAGGALPGAENRIQWRLKTAAGHYRVRLPHSPAMTPNKEIGVRNCRI